MERLRFIFSPRNFQSPQYGDYIIWSHNNLPDLESSRILEVGAGYGIFTQLAKAQLKPGSIVALDIDLNALHSIKEKDSDIDLVCADAEDLPFCDAAFDFVYSISALEHLIQPLRGIEEHCRVSRNFIMVQIPNLRYWIEIHTMFPLLAFMPKKVRRTVSEKRSAFYINYDVDFKMLVGALEKNARIYRIRKLYLRNALKLLFQPHGFQVIAQKINRRS